MASTTLILTTVVLLLMLYIVNRISIALIGNVDIALITAAVIFVTAFVIFRDLLCTVDSYSILDITPEKQCDDPFFYQSDPVKQKFCSQFSPSQLGRYRCPPGYYGAPITWERTSMSDDCYNNHMCDKF